MPAKPKKGDQVAKDDRENGDGCPSNHRPTLRRPRAAKGAGNDCTQGTSRMRVEQRVSLSPITIAHLKRIQGN